jgi:hypothetical protein
MLRSVEARLARALIARDYIEVRIRHWRPDEAWDEALYFFESLLLSLAGAMDAVARALDAALQLNSNAWSIGFRKTNWRQAVADHSPRLGELMPQGSRLRSVVDAVAVLRNYIHEEVLSSEMLSDSGTPDIVDYGRGLLALSSTAADELYTATAEVGGAAAWGLEDHMGGGNTTVMPVLFERTAIRRVLEVIRELMATNLVPDAAPSVERPIDPGFWLPSARYGPHLRLLASLDDPPD